MDEETTTAQEQIKVSIYTPLIYVGILLTAFISFSIIYRRRKVNKLTKVEPIFQENHAASLYNFLKEQYKNPDAPKETKPHERVMKAALLRRAVEAIRRSLKLKENEPIFTKLYQEGLIGDDIFKQFEIQGKLQEYELNEIIQECESYKKGWMQQFFPVAQEICFNEALRRRLKAMDDRSKSLSELWEYYVEITEQGAPNAKKTANTEVEEKSKEKENVSEDLNETKESKVLDDDKDSNKSKNPKKKSGKNKKK